MCETCLGAPGCPDCGDDAAERAEEAVEDRGCQCEKPFPPARADGKRLCEDCGEEFARLVEDVLRGEVEL